MGLFTEDIEQVVQSFPLFRHFFSTYMFNLVLYSKTSLFKSFFLYMYFIHFRRYFQENTRGKIIDFI